MKTEIERYHSLAIALHWAMALGLLFMLASGLFMANADIPKADQFRLYQLHKAAGVVMLVAIFTRLLIRVFTHRPALPAQMPANQQKLAELGHVGLYALLVSIPLAGWVMVSASPFGLPTFVFVDWLKWPHIPGIARNKEIEAIAKAAHWYLGLTLMLMLTVHIGAVFLHKQKQGINLIKRMWWK